ncbi:MAG TPA: transposase [Candidatus Tectomicrobia bacterium]
MKTVDDEAIPDVTIRLGDCVPPNHLARFVVDTIAHLDLSAISTRYGVRGGQPSAPEILFGLLCSGSATGVCSARKLERATGESVPCRGIAGNLHPDPDTLAAFRQTFLPALQDLCVQGLVLAQGAGVWKRGALSLDGTPIHADASKSHAVSSQPLLSLEAPLRAEVEEGFARSERTDQRDVPDGMVGRQAIALRHARLARLAAAHARLEARAKDREAAEQAADEATLQAREEKARRTGRTPRGRSPTPPPPGPRATDQDHVTDPASRSMNNSPNQGFDPHDNAQVAVDQARVRLVGESRSHHPTDQAEADPPLDSIPPERGTPEAAALAAGALSAANIALFERRNIAPYIATGRDPPHPSWQERCAAPSPALPEDASPQVQMAYTLQTAMGKAIDSARKSTVEPVIGILKEGLGCRQCSLRGAPAAAGEWCLGCLAFPLQRLPPVLQGSLRLWTAETASVNRGGCLPDAPARPALRHRGGAYDSRHRAVIGCEDCQQRRGTKARTVWLVLSDRLLVLQRGFTPVG